jgi:phage-related protein
MDGNNHNFDLGGVIGSLIKAVSENVKDDVKQVTDIPKSVMEGFGEVKNAVFDFSGNVLDHVTRVMRAVTGVVLALAKEIFDLVKIPPEHALNLIRSLSDELIKLTKEVLSLVTNVLPFAPGK